MSNIVVVREQDVRVASFQRAEIRIHASSEIDVFRDLNAEPMPFEIHIRMLRPERGKMDGSLSFGQNSLSISPVSPGAEIRILGEDGRYLDEEMKEVLVWELIEYSEAGMDYIYGRDPIRIVNGQTARIGDVVKVQHEVDHDFSI